VTFTDNGNGTATIGGTPAAGTAGAYDLTIGAQNGVNPVTHQAFTLTVNSTPSTPVITTTSPPDATLGASYSAPLAASGGVTPYAWTISQGSLPAGLALNSASGLISGTPTALGTSSFTVQVADAESPPASATAQLSILVGLPPQITSPVGASFTVGKAGTFTVTASGFPTPNLSLVDVVAPPAGVTFTDNGNGTATIGGTPAAGTAGVYDLTIRAQNGSSYTEVAYQGFTLTVNSLLTPPVVSTTSLPGATVGASYSAPLAASGGVTPYAWTISQGSLPAGLALNSASGLISGTPTALGTSSFTVKVADAESSPATATVQLSITVGSAPRGHRRG
jgi:hypothetical protein